MITYAGKTVQIATWCRNDDSLMMKKVQSISGFDIREARVGLTAARWCAEVPRATAFCLKHSQIEELMHV